MDPKETDQKPEPSETNTDKDKHKTHHSSDAPDQAEFNQQVSQPSQPNDATPPQPAGPSGQHTNSSAGIIVLQWLTYAFWGWTVLAMSFLTGTVISSLISGTEPGDFIAYSIASVLVLLPISLVTDFYYSKHEPDKKTGASSIVMVIHAVIFALCGIAALIGAVFSVVTMLISGSDSEGNQVAFVTAIIILALYIATFLRTINLVHINNIQKIYRIFMSVAVGLIVVLGIVGPVAAERATKNDRLIEKNLSQISSAVNSYAGNNNQLPSDLSNVDLIGDAQKVVDMDLVRYVKEENSSVIQRSETGIARDSAYKTYYYQLCATYTEEAESPYYKYDTTYYSRDNEYKTYPETSSHPAGEYCYKLKTVDYNY
ncbi:MAG TPA: hypothetical protein VFX79_00545 [Candidatus Saccharimonadales bacterium]|nr:hypothetical protein [Candidatus Saccharimonadales bacterium]